MTYGPGSFTADERRPGPRRFLARHPVLSALAIAGALPLFLVGGVHPLLAIVVLATVSGPAIGTYHAERHPRAALDTPYGRAVVEDAAVELAEEIVADRLGLHLGRERTGTGRRGHALDGRETLVDRVRDRVRDLIDRNDGTAADRLRDVLGAPGPRTAPPAQPTTPPPPPPVPPVAPRRTAPAPGGAPSPARPDGPAGGVRGVGGVGL